MRGARARAKTGRSTTKHRSHRQLRMKASRTSRSTKPSRPPSRASRTPSRASGVASRTPSRTPSLASQRLPSGTPIPRSRVSSIASSGEASKILLAGFDGYSDLKRTKIIDNLFYLYSASKKSIPLIAITPTTYSVPSTSIFVL